MTKTEAKQKLEMFLGTLDSIEHEELSEEYRHVFHEALKEGETPAMALAIAKQSFNYTNEDPDDITSKADRMRTRP